MSTNRQHVDAELKPPIRTRRSSLAVRRSVERRAREPPQPPAPGAPWSPGPRVTEPSRPPYTLSRHTSHLPAAEAFAAGDDPDTTHTAQCEH